MDTETTKPPVATEMLPKSVVMLADVATTAIWLAALPWLYLFASDVVNRSDVSWLVLLPLLLIPLFYPLLILGGQVCYSRGCWSIGMLVGAGALSVLAAWASSPWLALLSVVVGSFGWCLLRLASQAWYRSMRALVPLAALLILPISDASNWTPALERQVAKGSGVLLDVLKVPNLVEDSRIEMRFEAPLDAAIASRGLASPYTLFCLAAVLLIFTSRSLFGGLLSLCTVPLWSWLSATIHLTLAAWLWERYGSVIFVGTTRNMVFQLAFLLFGLLCVYLTRVLVVNLLAPLANVSSDASWTHAAFNQLAMWPNLDGEFLDTGKLKDGDVTPKRMDHRVFLAASAVVVVSCVAGSVFGVQRFSAARARITRVGLNIEPEGLENLEVPDELGDLRRIGPMSVQLGAVNRFSEQSIVSWTYADGLQRVEISLRTPYRGSVALEDGLVNQVRRPSEPRSTIAKYDEQLGSMFVSDVMLLDELYGRSYLCYLSATASGDSPMQTISLGRRLGIGGLRDSLTVQPTAYVASLFVEGTGRMSEEERGVLEATLVEFVRRVKDQLK